LSNFIHHQVIGKPSNIQYKPKYNKYATLSSSRLTKLTVDNFNNETKIEEAVNPTAGRVKACIQQIIARLDVCAKYLTSIRNYNTGQSGAAGCQWLASLAMVNLSVNLCYSSFPGILAARIHAHEAQRVSRKQARRRF